MKSLQTLFLALAAVLGVSTVAVNAQAATAHRVAKHQGRTLASNAKKKKKKKKKKNVASSSKKHAKSHASHSKKSHSLSQTRSRRSLQAEPMLVPEPAISTGSAADASRDVMPYNAGAHGVTDQEDIGTAKTAKVDDSAFDSSIY